MPSLTTLAANQAPGAGPEPSEPAGEQRHSGRVPAAIEAARHAVVAARKPLAYYAVGRALTLGTVVILTLLNPGVHLAKLLSEHGGRGLISVCTAGGMGVAAIMEGRKAAEMRLAA